ncbi:MAG: VTT domain-containing protein [Lunatimonas sp.]|nr:VTT domain-containing protein [Lunatimonas sp.]
MLVNYDQWTVPVLDSLLSIGIFVAVTACSMGFALIPTTLLAILSGYIWGWQAFPYLIAAYTLAAALGYLAGRSVSADMLDPLLEQYPKARKAIDTKRQQIGSLIFFIRISPAIPFAFSNILFALLGTGLKRVLWFGLWGMLPRTTLAFSSGIFAENLYEAIHDASRSNTDFILIFCFLAISIVGIWHFFRQKS